MSENQRSTNAVDVGLGRRVRARRLELGMSQETLADLLGVTFQQVQKYEKGVNRIAASRLWDISNALDVPVARFFAGFDARGAADPQAPLIELMATAEGAELVMLFASINGSESRRRVISLVTALTNDGIE